MKSQVKRLLVLDGEPQNCVFLSKFVKRNFGYQVDCASTPDRAIELLKKLTFDGVLLEVGENGAGTRVLDWLRSEKRREPVIMMSEAADWELLIHMVNRGAVDLLGKPLQSSTLARTIRTFIDDVSVRKGSGVQSGLRACAASPV